MHIFPSSSNKKKKKKLEDRGRRLQQQQSQDLCWALMERVSSGWVLGTHDPSTTPMTQFLSNRNLQYAGICLEGLLQDWGTLQVTERGTRNLKVILALSKTPLSVTLHDSIWKSNRLFTSSQLQVCKRYHGFRQSNRTFNTAKTPLGITLLNFTYQVIWFNKPWRRESSSGVP